MSAPYNFPYIVARRTLDLLVNHKVMRHQVGTVFYVWQRDDRLIVAFDPSSVVLDKLSDGFAHELSTILKGRRVVRTNSRGIFFQVGFEVPPVPMSLDPIPLDLSQQASPWHVPIGLTKEGPFWVSLMDADSVLVGGTRRMGKSGFTHGLIQALLHGGKTQVYAWDGKGGLEYQGYAGQPKFHFIGNAARGMLELRQLMEQRKAQLQASGYNSTAEHNKAGEEFIEPVALIVDEIALIDDITKRELKQMIELYGAMGLYAVLATNNPTQAAILVKSNLSTRICFSVPSFTESLIVLSHKGAENLTKGRGLILWENKVVQFQPFRVTYPTPTQEQRRLVAEQALLQPVNTDPIADLAETIRDRWSAGMSKRAVGRLLGLDYAGSYARKIDQVIEYLSATTTTETPATDENDQEAG